MGIDAIRGLTCDRSNSTPCAYQIFRHIFSRLLPFAKATPGNKGFMASKNNKVTLTPKTIAGIALASLGITALYGLVAWIIFDGQWKDSGPFGDTFGFLTAFFSGASLIGVIIAVFLQTEELKAQREDLELTRNELKESRVAQQLQAEQLLKSAEISAIQSKLDIFRATANPRSLEGLSDAIYSEQASNVVAGLISDLDELIGHGGNVTKFPIIAVGIGYTVTNFDQKTFQISITPLQTVAGGSAFKCKITNPNGTVVKEDASIPTGCDREDITMTISRKVTIDNVCSGTYFMLSKSMIEDHELTISIYRPKPITGESIAATLGL